VVGQHGESNMHHKLDFCTEQNRPAMNEYKCTKAKEKSHYIEVAQGAIFMLLNMRIGDW
jgi:hypothetical protein